MDDTHTEGHDRFTILLVALEPRSYREAIGSAIAALRPELSVRIADPQDLVQETARFRSALVLCSRKKHLTAPAATQWIEYYADEDAQPPAVFVNGRREETPALDLEGMLALVDRTLAPQVQALRTDNALPSPIESLAETLIDSLADSPAPRPSTP